jgi:DNA-binding NarL/FixJ family response regulator
LARSASVRRDICCPTRASVQPGDGNGAIPYCTLAHAMRASTQWALLSLDDPPNGLDALIAIRTEFPDARIIMLTTYEGDVHILRALKAGGQGYLLKNTLHSELLHTIRAVHGGKRSLSSEASFQVAQHVSDQALTPAEVVVLRLIAGGNANKQIADQLAITEDTVKGRVISILVEAGRQRPDACGDHRPQEMNHRALVGPPHIHFERL